MKFLQGLGDDFYSDGLYQGRIVPLGVLPAPLKIPVLPTTSTTAVKAVAKLKTPEQMRALNSKIFVAKQTNSEKGYTGATITPFQVKESLVTGFKLRDIPSEILAASVPELEALFDVLQYAVFTKKITDAQNKDLRLKSGFFDGGPQPPLTFQQWLALVDQALALSPIITPLVPPTASEGSSESGDLSDVAEEGISTGVKVGLGISAVLLVGGLGYAFMKRKRK